MVARKVAEHAILRYTVMKQLRLERSSWLLIWKAGTNTHYDLEHSSVKLGHWPAKISNLPDERIFVHQFDVKGDTVVSLVAFDYLLKLALEVDRNA